LVGGDAAEDASAIQAGHHQVEQDDHRRADAAQGAQGSETVGRLIHGETGVLEREAQRLAYRLVVIYNQHPRHGWHSPMLLPSSLRLLHSPRRGPFRAPGPYDRANGWRRTPITS
jgi:hypothetical protein